MTGQTATEILLDATTLEPPEPLKRALQILQHLQPGQYLRMLHRRLPYPLFDACKQIGIEHRHLADERSTWIILFWRSDDSATAEYCEQLSI